MAEATLEKPETGPGLELVTPHPDPNVNILLYSPPKAGKTVAAASAPKPLLYLNADRPNATRFAHGQHEFDEVRVTGLETLVAVAEAAETGDYATIVLDTVAETYRILLEQLSGRALSPAIQNYGDAGTHLERFCRHLCEVPVNFVMVAHSIEVTNEETGGVDHLPFVTSKSGSPVFAAKLLAMVDVIGYTGIVHQEDEPPRYVATLTNAKGRRGGDRFGVLGTSRDLNLTEWVDLARAETKTDGENAGEGQ